MYNSFKQIMGGKYTRNEKRKIKSISRIGISDKLILIPVAKIEDKVEYIVHNLSTGYIERMILKVNKKNKPNISDLENLGGIKNYLDKQFIEHNSSLKIYVLPMKNKKYYDSFIKESVFTKIKTKSNDIFNSNTKILNIESLLSPDEIYFVKLEEFWNKIRKGEISTYTFELNVRDNSLRYSQKLILIKNNKNYLQ